MEKLNNLNFAKTAEKSILSLRTENRGRTVLKPSNSQIRNLLVMTNNLYNQAKKEKGKEISPKLQSDIQYVRMKFAYAAGREPDVKRFVDNTELMSHINNIGTDKAQLLIFCKYMESLVAYHKYYGGDK